MVRVNLLPREIIDRRKYEQWYRYVFIGVIGVVLIVLFIYAGLFLLVQQKNEELQSLQEQTVQLQAQADAFGVFEVKEQELIAREQVAQTALTGRINMGRLAEEISLVLPDEIWLNSISLSQSTGVALDGSTPRSTSESFDIAYKSIAKMLVRLNELPALTDVWLTNATNSSWSAWATTEGDQTPLPVDVVGFQATSKVLSPAAAAAVTTSGTVAPAPTTSGN